MAEWTIQPASNFNPGMDGYYLCEGDVNVAFFREHSGAGSALITVRILATEKEALHARVRELEAIIRDHVPFADHLLEPATDEPEPVVQPLDTEYTSEMSYYGGYSNNFRLVEAGNRGVKTYWIIAVKQDHLPDGESIMYRYDNLDDALAKFIDTCKHFDTTTIELNTGSEAP